MMRELLSSNDLVHLSWARAMLAAEGIDSLLLDDHVSGVEGSIGAIPRRLMVADELFDQASQVLERAQSALAKPAPARD